MLQKGERSMRCLKNIPRARIIATAKGKTKKEAQQNCAYEACKVLGAIKE